MMLREKGNHYAIGSNSLAKCFETVHVCGFCLSPCSKNSKCAKREPTGSKQFAPMWAFPYVNDKIPKKDKDGSSKKPA